jgi:hypothetical protein
MARAKVADIKLFKKKPKRKRPGRHSKKGASKLKQSKLYTKKYRGQGK